MTATSKKGRRTKRTRSLLADVIIINKELGVLVMRREIKSRSGWSRGNRIIVTHGTPTVTEALLELILGNDEALLNIMILLTAESDCLHDSMLSLA